jgi:acyl-CoA dehydrogenase
MSETGSILHNTATRLFQSAFTPAQRAQAAAGEWPAAQWAQLEEMGLPTALVPEARGGYGLEPAEALSLLRLAGFHALPLPLAETMLAHWLAALSGLTATAGPMSFAATLAEDALRLEQHSQGWRVSGTLHRVPWGRQAAVVLVQVAHGEASYLCRLTPAHFEIGHDTNLAGEARDSLRVDAVLEAGEVAPAPAGIDRIGLTAIGAGVRCLAIAGATDRVLQMSVAYANERRQFGRPIGKFQAVQQNLAVLAAQAAAAGAAADLAAEAIDTPPRLLPIAAAKVRAAEAAGAAASIAHQVHGAIGFTEEHSLHLFTKRLWAWRDEFGSESHWSRLVGRQAAAAGADDLWALIASV